MNHIDCKYYLAVDVFKGLCKRTKESIIADEAACADFENAPKCKHCKNFSTTVEYMGLCKDKAAAYPDMKADNCKDFLWK